MHFYTLKYEMEEKMELKPSMNQLTKVSVRICICLPGLNVFLHTINLQ